MEFLPGGDLLHHLERRGAFPRADVQFYTAETALGLWFLHAHNVIYRDLKPDNVLLSASGHVKLADFGLCKLLPAAGRRADAAAGCGGGGPGGPGGPGLETRTFCGTTCYIAPEMLREEAYGYGVDWWALGVMTHEMLTGQSLFEGDSDDDTFGRIANTPIASTFTRGMDAAARGLLEGLLDRHPQTRLGCYCPGGGKGGGESGEGQRQNQRQSSIRRHPFFQGLDWSKLERQEVPAPFVPAKQSSSTDARNFDTDAVGPGGCPRAGAVLAGARHRFAGFSFTDGSLQLGARPRPDSATTPAADGGDGTGDGGDDTEIVVRTCFDATRNQSPLTSPSSCAECGSMGCHGEVDDAGDFYCTQCWDNYRRTLHVATE